MTAIPPQAFADDLAFLERHGEPIVLSSPDGGVVAVSPQYQARVMTSAVSPSGGSLGWIHRTFIEEGRTGTPFDNYGGEDRFWLGPEGGQYGLYFDEGAPFTLDRWRAPRDLQEGAWEVTHRDVSSARFARTMTVGNWSGASFTLSVLRTVRLLGRREAAALLGLPEFAASDAGFVGYETVNRVTNAGEHAWRRETGLVSIWILGMFPPARDAEVIVPFETGPGGPIVNDRYFGEVPPERLVVREAEGYLVFRGDGRHRSKIGLGPRRARSALGSRSADTGVLTVVHYDGPQRGAPYVDSMWQHQAAPYDGDVVNSYNDGPLGPGALPLGGFYELETSSPAAELAPGASLVHTHRTLHFTGEPSVLDPIAAVALGVSRGAGGLRDVRTTPR
jgi:hypothetical protein